MAYKMITGAKEKKTTADKCQKCRRDFQKAWPEISILKRQYLGQNLEE